MSCLLIVSLIILQCLPIFSSFRVFFSDQFAAANAGGETILPGTPLIMPSNPEYDAFFRIINQVGKSFTLKMEEFT